MGELDSVVLSRYVRCVHYSNDQAPLTLNSFEDSHLNGSTYSTVSLVVLPKDLLFQKGLLCTGSFVCG